MSSERVWGLKPRWDGTQGFTQWAQIIGGWVIGLLMAFGMVACAVDEWKMARDGTRFEVTYIDTKDGPVKCMYDNSWDETFACEWPTGETP